DCKEDYRNLDRVYVPQDAMAAAGVSVEALGAERASPALRDCLHKLAARTERLLSDSDIFSVQINDTRLALEVAVINTLAHRLTALLQSHDPLSERVHLGKGAVAGLTLLGAACGLMRRFGRRSATASQKVAGRAE